MGRTGLPSDKRQQVWEMWKAGDSISVIAKAVGSPAGSIFMLPDVVAADPHRSHAVPSYLKLLRDEVKLFPLNCRLHQDGCGLLRVSRGVDRDESELFEVERGLHRDG